MSSCQQYLSPNVAIEPLYNQWYVWWYLLSPATAPLFVTNLHLKVMASFCSNPEVHVAALENPALAGGPFINYPISRAGEIKALLERTSREQAHMIGYTKAVGELEQLLTTAGTGHSLEGAYAKVPAALRGYVELTYDLGNRPHARFIEPLLYRSQYHQESSQSISLSAIVSDQRRYVFSTPRLEAEGSTWLTIPFRHEGIDELFRMRTTAGSPGQLAEMLEVPGSQAKTFATLFTESPPRKADRYQGPGVRLRYFGHACVLIESQDVTILTDPVVSYEFPTELARFSHADLPERIDYVLITHGHADHLMLETLLQIRHRVTTFVVPRNSGGALADPSLRLMLQHAGFRNVLELDELETLPIPGGNITALPFLGEHCDLDIRAKAAHLVRLSGKSMLMAADSNALESRLYEHLHDVFGDIDVLFLGMECEGGPMSWMYGPLLARPLPRKVDQSRRLNGSDCTRALEIIGHFNPKEVYIYAMGQEPWLRHVMVLAYDESAPQIVESNRLLDICRARGIRAERPFARMERILD